MLGGALVVLAIVCCVLLGTLGSFLVGFGMLTDCTNSFNCTETGCQPCEPPARWLDAGALLQLGLVVCGVVVLVRSGRWTRPVALPLAGMVLLASSVAAFAGTTWLAGASY